LQLFPIRLAPDASRRTLSIRDRLIGSRAACARCGAVGMPPDCRSGIRAGLAPDPIMGSRATVVAAGSRRACRTNTVGGRIAVAGSQPGGEARRGTVGSGMAGSRKRRNMTPSRAASPSTHRSRRTRPASIVTASQPKFFCDNLRATSATVGLALSGPAFVLPQVSPRQQHGGHLACVSASPFRAEEGSEDFAGRNEKRLVLIVHPRRRTERDTRWPLTLRSTRLTTSTTG
jgi:hypothetical protein